MVVVAACTPVLFLVTSVGLPDLGDIVAQHRKVLGGASLLRAIVLDFAAACELYDARFPSAPLGLRSLATSRACMDL